MRNYGALFLLLLCVALFVRRVDAQTATPTPQIEESWLTLPDMPADATQANYGAEIYRLVCQDCHGGVGQGLTDEWRAEAFTPEDQNCWQSKCHNGTHPVDGFVLPKYIPPVAGETALASFTTSLDLYNYIREAMPYHNRGSMLDIEYMQVTAFITELNGKIAAPQFDADDAASIVLNPERLVPTPFPTPQPEAPATAQPSWLWSGIIAIGVIVTVGMMVLYQRFARQKNSP